LEADNLGDCRVARPHPPRFSLYLSFYYRLYLY